MTIDGAQRRREARIRRKRYFYQLLLLFSLLAFLTFLVFGTDFFLIESIEFLDEEYVEESALLQQSQLAFGKHIFFVDTGKAAQNLKKMGYVQEVSILRVFPDQIKIYITPREPAFVLKEPEGFAYVDSKGVVAERVSISQRWDIPLVTGLEDRLVKVEESQGIDSEPSWISKEVVGTIQILIEEGLDPFIAEIHCTEDGQLHLYSKGGSVIKTAGQENMKSKIDFLFTYLSEKDDRMIIDLTHGGNPTFTPRQ